MVETTRKPRVQGWRMGNAATVAAGIEAFVTLGVTKMPVLAWRTRFFVVYLHLSNICIQGECLIVCAIRLVVSDLDGTLLSSEHRLTGPVKETIREFRKRGGLFTFATGRPLLTAAAFASELQLELPYILCNGSVMAENGKLIDSIAFQAGELAGLLEEADDAGVDAFMFHEESITVFRTTDTVHEYESKERFLCTPTSRNSDEWKSAAVQKIILMGDVPLIRKLWQTHAAGFGDRFSAFQSEDNYWEIVPGGRSKGAALRRLADALGVRREETMAIGNQMNDLDMICYAGVGVAVANSPEDLKAEADYVCGAGYGEGVIEAMERFCGTAIRFG